jgi:hypothetical protein
LLIFGNFFIEDWHKTQLTRKLSQCGDLGRTGHPAAILQAEQNSSDDGLSNFTANELF